MGSVRRLWRRRLTLAIGLAGTAVTTMGVSQCGTTGTSTVTVSGTTLTIYASVPSSDTGTQAQDLIDAEQLAFEQSGSGFNKFTLRFTRLGETPSDNARTAIQDTDAIAYIGEPEPGASADSMGITEDQDLLQVSPTDTAIALTQSTPAVSGAPKSYYEAYSTYKRTFARVVPSGAAEARAQVEEMRALGVTQLYVADDGSDYGDAIAYAVRQDASSAGLSVATLPSGNGSLPSINAPTDGVFVGASPSGAGLADHYFGGVGGRVKLFAPSALASASLPAGTYVSEPGFLPKDLPASATTQFVKPFEAAYGHAPSTEAIFGYEAMSAVLAVLHEAGSAANNRSTVVHDFFSITNRSSVLGTYSIDSDGDISIAPFVFSRPHAGGLVPFKFVQASP
jgi:branched-chain amino acid transport system substrate-binding protein